MIGKPITGPGQLGPCHCSPGRCMAPVIMGRQTPCLRDAKQEGDLMKPETPTKTELRDEIERLNLELQKRDKCSFIGPMRDCPTHGESKDAARYRWLRRQPWVKTKGIHAWGELLDNAIDEARHDAPTETPNVRANLTKGAADEA